jgi:hypothetical protein
LIFDEGGNARPGRREAPLEPVMNFPVKKFAFIQKIRANLLNLCYLWRIESFTTRNLA